VSSTDIVSSQKRFFVLGAWTLLVVLCWVFHWWRVYAVSALDWHKLSGFPVLLLVADVAVIAVGLCLPCCTQAGGRTARQRFHATLYVGALCVVSMSLLFVDVFRNIFFGAWFEL